MHNQGMLKEGALKNKTYIVTGGGSGLGKSMSSYLLNLGANVVIVSRNKEKLESAKKDLEPSCFEGNNIDINPCDVRESDAVDMVVNNSFKKYGRIDGIINNAAGNFISPTENLSSNAFTAVLPGSTFWTNSSAAASSSTKTS